MLEVCELCNAMRAQSTGAARSANPREELRMTFAGQRVHCLAHATKAASERQARRQAASPSRRAGRRM